MNWLQLYLLLLEVTCTTFNGQMSLPVLRDELVVKQHALTDAELNVAVTAAQSAPGPMGIYVVSVGYFVAGLPGAVAGMLAMVTPSFLIIPLIRYAGHNADHPRVKRTLEATVIASAGMIVTATGPLARGAITDPWQIALAAGAFVLTVAKVPTVLVVLGAALLGVLWQVF